MSNEQMQVSITVDGELFELLLKQWLKQRLEWTQDEYNYTTHADDKAEAATDLICLSRVYKYVTGEDWKPDELDVEFQLTVSERDD